jgi:hypothetical protein
MHKSRCNENLHQKRETVAFLRSLRHGKVNALQPAWSMGLVGFFTSVGKFLIWLDSEHGSKFSPGSSEFLRNQLINIGGSSNRVVFTHFLKLKIQFIKNSLVIPHHLKSAF